MMATELELVESLCRTAGAKLMQWRGDQNAIAEYPGRPGKLNADIALHELMCEALNAITPNVTVISEEDLTHDNERPSLYWIIDPIDGTASWVGGYDGFVVQAALIVEGEPRRSVVHAPALDVTFTAEQGRGAYRNGVILPKLLDSQRLAVVDNYPTPKRAAAQLMRRLPQASYIESGSLGLKACLVASGAADLFVKDVMVRDWDMAPAAVLAAETGAVMENPAGGCYRFYGPIAKPDGVIVARNAKLAAMARDILLRKETS